MYEYENRKGERKVCLERGIGERIKSEVRKWDTGGKKIRKDRGEDKESWIRKKRMDLG